MGIVRSAYRPDQRVEISRLVDLPSAGVGMLTVIIVGNSQTEVYGGKLVTPRGYAGKYSLAGRETGDDASA